MSQLGSCTWLYEGVGHHMIGVLTAAMELPLNHSDSENMTHLSDDYAWYWAGTLHAVKKPS